MCQNPLVFRLESLPEGQSYPRKSQIQLRYAAIFVLLNLMLIRYNFCFDEKLYFQSS